MNAANQEVIEKLKKILRLANDRGAQPGEVESAFARAKEIAMRHGLDIAGIDISGKDDHNGGGMDIGRVDVHTRAANPQKYHRWICSVLQEVFGVAVVQCGNRYTFIGEATDNLICQALFPWLEDVFYKTYNAAANAGVVQRNAAGKNSVYLGLYRGMKEANKRVEEELSTQDRSKWAMVVRDKNALVQARMTLEFPNAKDARKSHISLNSAGIGFGYAKGKSINLRQANNGSVHAALKG